MGQIFWSILDNALLWIFFCRSTKTSTFPLPLKQDQLRMHIAPDRTIILGLQIVLDHGSLSSIGQKILVIRHPHGRDWDGWIVIICSLRAPSVLIMHAWEDGPGELREVIMEGVGKIFGIFWISFAGCVNILWKPACRGGEGSYHGGGWHAIGEITRE